ncbi:MAG: hypothetical protein HY722_13540, partial [Planctomycetes bacterium]|nr:hypothetical protein [Planctomycetota bacterium]
MEEQGYNPQVLARLRESLGEMDRTDLVQILSHVIKVYVIESTAPFRIRLPAVEGESPAAPDALATTPGGGMALGFPRLVRALQEQYRLPELDRFRVEGEDVRLRVDGGEVLFRDGRVSFAVAPAGAAAAPAPP